LTIGSERKNILIANFALLNFHFAMIFLRETDTKHACLPVGKDTDHNIRK